MAAEGGHNGADHDKFEMQIQDDARDDNSNDVRPRSKLKTCYSPLMASSHPLETDASIFRRFGHNFFCPPHSRVGAILFILFITATGWATLYFITGEAALPGGNLFSLFVLFIACWCGGYVVQLLRLPPLLGMLLVGGILGNVSPIDIANDIHQEWSSGCRLISLCIILIRAGLGLDTQALKRLSFVVARLACLPCLVEALVDGVAAHLILGFPWSWAIMLGFVIAAVSPAVVVPSLLGLSDRGYGLDKGIPTLIIAAASIDDVLSITGFGVLLGISFSTGNIVWTLFKGPLEAVVGVLYGIVTGVILWYIPQTSSKHLVLFRSTLLLAFGLMAIFGSRKIEWSGAGPLGALTLPFVAAMRWRAESTDGKKPIAEVVGVLWMLFQPLLFGLIGAEVKISLLTPDTVGLGIAVLCIGMTFRVVVAFLSVFKTDLNTKERLFVPIAWLPKATVQAAIGAVALDNARAAGDEDLIVLGQKVLELAVLVIIVTAPLGSLGISLAGPRLLKQTSTEAAVAEEQNRTEKVDNKDGADARLEERSEQQDSQSLLNSRHHTQS